MALRADVFLLLRKKYFTLRHSKDLYEFCHDWVSQGNPTIDGAEEAFQKYLESLSE